jgi:hypothetical protein
MRPFNFSRRPPFPLLLLLASLPLVRASVHYDEMRGDYLESARSPGLYLQALDLAQMGGEPYADWN